MRDKKFIRKVAKQNSWDFIKEDKNTFTLFFQKGDLKLTVWLGKESVAIAPKGKPQKFLKHLWLEEEDWDGFFKKIMNFYKEGYKNRMDKHFNTWFM